MIKQKDIGEVTEYCRHFLRIKNRIISAKFQKVVTEYQTIFWQRHHTWMCYLGRPKGFVAIYIDATLCNVCKVESKRDLGRIHWKQMIER